MTTDSPPVAPTNTGQQVAGNCKPCHVAHRSTYNVAMAGYICCMCGKLVTERDRTYIWGTA